MSYQSGDIVICIEPTEDIDNYKLLYGEEYTVRECRDGYHIALKETGHIGWLTERFIPANEFNLSILIKILKSEIKYSK